MIPDFCFSNFCGFGRDAIRHADRLANASLFAQLRRRCCCRGIRRIHPNQQIAAYEPARRVSLLLCLCMAHCLRANFRRSRDRNIFFNNITVFIITVFWQECLNTVLAGVLRHREAKGKISSNIREGNLYAAEDAVGGAEGALRHKSV